MKVCVSRWILVGEVNPATRAPGALGWKPLVHLDSSDRCSRQRLACDASTLPRGKKKEEEKKTGQGMAATGSRSPETKPLLLFSTFSAVSPFSTPPPLPPSTHPKPG